MFNLRKKAILFLKSYTIDFKIEQKLLKLYPELSYEHMLYVKKAFIQYMAFRVLQHTQFIKPTHLLSSPSKIIYDLWLLISQEKDYYAFCEKVFGKTINVIPTQEDTRAIENAYFKSYYHVFDLEKYELGYHINGCPLIFSLDSLLLKNKCYNYNQSFIRKISSNHAKPAYNCIQYLVPQQAALVPAKHIVEPASITLNEIIDVVDSLDDIIDVVSDFWD